MKSFLLQFFFCLFSILMVAQSFAQHREIVQFDFNIFPATLLKSNLRIDQSQLEILNKNQIGRFFSGQLEIPSFQEPPFIAFSADWKGKNLNPKQFQVMMITSEDGENWGHWIPLKPDAHARHSTRQHISELQFLDPKTRYFRYYLRFEQGAEVVLENLSFHFFDPGKTGEATENAENNGRNSGTDCPCPLPDFMGRDDWCPGGDCPADSSPVPTSVSHLIIHHSAGSNTAGDWAAVVRSIWDYHVNTNGWPDIGYNWLIDPNGVLYEGVGTDLRGAHFCGANSGTMGVCMMGNYTLDPPTETAQDKLVELLSWNSCYDNLDPLGQSYHASSGLTLNHISGHRDGCPTECPGNSFYPLFDDIRQQVDAYIDNNCSNGLPDLVIDDILTAPNQVEAGIEVDLIAKIKNIGEVSASTIHVEHFLNNELQETDTLSSLSVGQFAFATISNYIFDFGGDYEYCAVISYSAAEMDSNNNVQCLVIDVDGITQFEEAESSESKIELFPNPGNGWFTVQSEANRPYTIQVLNVNGQEILIGQRTIENGTNLDLSALPDGLYYLKFFDDENAFFKKVIIQK